MSAYQAQRLLDGQALAAHLPMRAECTPSSFQGSCASPASSCITTGAPLVPRWVRASVRESPWPWKRSADDDAMTVCRTLGLQRPLQFYASQGATTPRRGHQEDGNLHRSTLTCHVMEFSGRVSQESAMTMRKPPCSSSPAGSSSTTSRSRTWARRTRSCASRRRRSAAPTSTSRRASTPSSAA